MFSFLLHHIYMYVCMYVCIYVCIGNVCMLYMYVIYIGNVCLSHYLSCITCHVLSIKNDQLTFVGSRSSGGVCVCVCVCVCVFCLCLFLCVQARNVWAKWVRFSQKPWPRCENIARKRRAGYWSSAVCVCVCVCVCVEGGGERECKRQRERQRCGTDNLLDALPTWVSGYQSALSLE